MTHYITVAVDPDRMDYSKEMGPTEKKIFKTKLTRKVLVFCLYLVFNVNLKIKILNFIF